MEDEKPIHPIQKAIGEAAAKKQVEIAVEALAAFVNRTYDKAIAYNNAVIMAGYVGAFAIWAFTRKYLAAWTELTIALLLTISIATFVFFEVYKMVLSSGVIVGANRIGAKPEPAGATLKRIAEFEAASRQKNRRLIQVWYVVMCVTVSTAMLAILLSAGNAIWLLVSGQLPKA